MAKLVWLWWQVGAIVLSSVSAVCFQNTLFINNFAVERFSSARTPARSECPLKCRKGSVAIKMAQSAFDATDGIDDWISSSSLKAQQLEKAKNLKVDFFTGEYAEIRNQDGKVVQPSSLRGSSVAMYFASAGCEQCKEFTGSLRKYFDAHNTACGDDPKMNVIFVSCDEAESNAKSHFNSMHPNWLMLDYNCNLRQDMKRRYGVWPGWEASIFGTSIAALRSRRGGVPAVVVVDSDGEPLEHLDGEALGVEALLGWVPRHQAWPA